MHSSSFVISAQLIIEKEKNAFFVVRVEIEREKNLLNIFSFLVL